MPRGPQGASGYGERLFSYRGPADVRREIAEAMPLYRGIETLAREGESFQWGGPFLDKDGDFAKMPGGLLPPSGRRPTTPCPPASP